MKITTLEQLNLLRDETQGKLPKSWIRIGLSTCGIAAGAFDVYQAFRDEIKKNKLQVAVKRCGCVGRCSMEPLVEIASEGMNTVTYGKVTKERVPEVVRAHIIEKQVVNDLVVNIDNPWQYKIVLSNCGVIDPESIVDYIAADGYQAMAKALLNFTPEQAVAEIKKSGLRGRGGAGFPTGTKWELTRKVDSDQRYIICNGDEGDPGAYMDRGIFEGDPHSVIEGMVIGGYACGASKGIMYIRVEYPLAVERTEKAIKQAYTYGLLGEKIMGTDFSFDIEVRLGAGAFVCGEETALIASVEGRRGYPHPRPPFPSVKGLWGKPTCVNNVETLANVTRIMLRGADWFNKIGFENSKGTKVFALTGKASHSGLVEIPMGTTLRQIVYDVGGGAAKGKKVKAIQTGGPSGGVIPEAYFDTAICYENMQKLGSIIGSGGLIVMDEDDSMVEIAKFYLGFCVEESCGKCAPCRIGGMQLLSLLEKICDGKGEIEDLNRMRRIAYAMQKASLCGLGQTAANPVLSTLRYFEDEYRARIKVPEAVAGK